MYVLKAHCLFYVFLCFRDADARSLLSICDNDIPRIYLTEYSNRALSSLYRKSIENRLATLASSRIHNEVRWCLEARLLYTILRSSYSRPARPKSENRFECRTILAAGIFRSVSSGRRVCIPDGNLGVASIATSGASLKETVTVILVRGRARPLRESESRRALSVCVCVRVCVYGRSVHCRFHLPWSGAKSTKLHNSRSVISYRSVDKKGLLPEPLCQN